MHCTGLSSLRTFAAFFERGNLYSTDRQSPPNKRKHAPVNGAHTSTKATRQRRLRVDVLHFNEGYIPDKATKATRQKIPDMRQSTVHVHISGSAGTSMCSMARQQHVNPGGAGLRTGGFNCLLGCKNPAMWERTYAMGNPSSKWFSYCLRPVETCAKLEAHLNGGFAEAENMLDESGSVGYHNLTVRFRAAMLAAECINKNCCGCNRPSLFHPPPDQRWEAGNSTYALQVRQFSGTHHHFSMLVVAAGEPSPYDELWPLSGWQPLSTYCSNIRYSFLMHEPIHRIVSQLLLLCPSANYTRPSAWAVAALRYIYVHDLVLDGNDKGHGFPGTPAASNFNTRVLLGPRVHFARLRALTETHHVASLELLKHYSVVVPVRSLSRPNTSMLIAQKLGWSCVPRVSRKNSHTSKRTGASNEASVLAELGDEIRRHNKWDMLMYEWVQRRFERDLELLSSPVGSPWSRAHDLTLRPC